MSAPPPQMAALDVPKLDREAIAAWETAFGEKWPPAGAPAVLQGVTEFNAVFQPIVGPYQAAVAAFFTGLPPSQCVSPASCIAAVSSFPAINATFTPAEEATINTHPLAIAESDTATGCAVVAWQDAPPVEPLRPNVRHWRLLYSQRIDK